MSNETREVVGVAGTARRQLWMCNTCKPVKVAQPGGSLEEVGDGRRQRFENESAAAAAADWSEADLSQENISSAL